MTQQFCRFKIRNLIGKIEAQGGIVYISIIKIKKIISSSVLKQFSEYAAGSNPINII